MNVSRTQLLPLVAALAAVLSLAACDHKADTGTVGEKVDATIAKVQQKSEQVGAEVRKDVEAAKATVGKTVDAATDKVKDAAITAGVKSELARDASLSVLKIDVDTSAGQVMLRGSAPSVAAREQATVLARRIEGVVGVDNQLKISSN